MPDNGNASAFPLVEFDPDEAAPKAHYGLTKREAFAGLAMQSLLGWFQPDETHFAGNARMAVEAADALLAELEKREAGG